MPKGDMEFECLNFGAFLAYLYCFVRVYFIIFSFRITVTICQVQQSWSFLANLMPSGMLINVDMVSSEGRVQNDGERFKFMMMCGLTQNCCLLIRPCGSCMYIVLLSV